jgi:predicted nucleotidyltransferase
MVQSEVIQEAVRRIVKHFEPEKVYLIGSAARGESREGSDLDFLVVVPDDTPRQKWQGGEIHLKLYGIGAPVDVIPLKRSTFEARSDWVMSLPAIALREGLLLYDGNAAAR